MSGSMPVEELEEMRATLAGFLDDHAPSARVREIMAGTEGYDASLWRRLADELGLIGAVVPESRGGLGLDFRAGAVLLGEFARRLTPVPFAETLVTAGFAAACGTQAADLLLAEIAEAAPLIAIGGAEPDADLPRAVKAPPGWQVTGLLRYVPFGRCADILLLVAETPRGPAVFAARTEAAGVQRTERRGLDATRPLTDFTLADVASELLADGPGAAALLTRLTLVTQAVEAAAGAAASLDRTVEYLTVREQFGRPIGSFQALQHRCADHAVRVVEAGATARHAAASASAEIAGEVPDEPLDVIAPLAKIVCARVYNAVAADMIQLHGGIGFTFEHDAHLYFKRAKATEHLYGQPDRLLLSLAAAAGL